MVVIDGTKCEERSLIEICVLPNANANKIIRDLAAQHPGSVLIENTLNLTLLGLEAFYIPEYKDLLAKLDTVKDTWLFIDSIALYVDNIRESANEAEVQRFYNKLWELIYNFGMTVIVINHFKVKRDPMYCRMVPRLGFEWYRMCSYRVLAAHKNDKVCYTITKNDMVEF